jgi:thiamine-phosphate pyrophosphorylase
MRCDPAWLRLYLVTDRRMRPELPLPELVRQAVAGGVTCVQLREKEAEGGEFLRLGLAVAEALAGTGVPLIVNDRIDVAAMVPGAGVHLGQQDLPIEAARRILGPDRIVGLSVNTVAEAREAERRGADYLGAGPAFPTGTKADTEPELGPDGLRRIVQAVRIPVVAIGGINETTIGRLRGLGLAGVAVVSAVCAAADPQRAAEALLRCLQTPPAS